MNKLEIVTLVLGVVALSFSITGFATPGWLRFKIDTSGFGNIGGILILRYGLGLWVVKVCAAEICTTIKNDVWENEEQVKFIADVIPIVRYQILTSIAIGSCILGTVFLLFYIRRTNLTDKCFGILSIGLLVLSGVLLWYVVGKFSKLANNLHPLFQEYSGLTAMAPYSVILTAIGATGSLLVAGLILVEICLTCNPNKGRIILHRNPVFSSGPLTTHTQSTHVGVTVHHN